MADYKLKTDLTSGESATLTLGDGSVHTLKVGSGGTVTVTDALLADALGLPGATAANADTREAVTTGTTDSPAVSPS